MLPSTEQIKNLLNIKNTQTKIEQVIDQTNSATQPHQEKQTASIPTSNGKYPVKNIQTYQVTVNNGKLVVLGKPTPYGRYNKADGIILYIQETRANKKSTIKVPFKNGTIRYEYPLAYTVGDVVVNLDETYNGEANDPNQVLGFAEFHLTDGDPYLQPSYMVQSSDPNIMALAKSITNGKSTNVEKSRAIFEWVAKNIAYNAPLVNSPNPPLYSALKTYQSRVVLCSGYADLSAALHRAVGIEAKVLYGENHAWNEINLNGVWQSEDPTYGSGFINANTNRFVRSYHPAYFTKTDKHKEGEYPW
jgi:transglutaminase-like putative cysteine protease